MDWLKETIRERASELGVMAYDYRHVLGYMFVGGRRDWSGMSTDDIRREIDGAFACIKLATPTEAELVARSFGM